MFYDIILDPFDYRSVVFVLHFTLHPRPKLGLEHPQYVRQPQFGAGDLQQFLTQLIFPVGFAAALEQLCRTVRQALLSTQTGIQWRNATVLVFNFAWLAAVAAAVRRYSRRLNGIGDAFQNKFRRPRLSDGQQSQ